MGDRKTQFMFIPLPESKFKDYVLRQLFLVYKLDLVVPDPISLIFRTNPVIFSTNPVIFRTNALILRTTDINKQNKTETDRNRQFRQV